MWGLLCWAARTPSEKLLPSNTLTLSPCVRRAAARENFRELAPSSARVAGSRVSRPRRNRRPKVSRPPAPLNPTDGKAVPQRVLSTQYQYPVPSTRPRPQSPPSPHAPIRRPIERNRDGPAESRPCNADRNSFPTSIRGHGVHRASVSLCSLCLCVSPLWRAGSKPTARRSYRGIRNTEAQRSQREGYRGSHFGHRCYPVLRAYPKTGTGTSQSPGSFLCPPAPLFPTTGPPVNPRHPTARGEPGGTGKGRAQPGTPAGLSATRTRSRRDRATWKAVGVETAAAPPVLAATGKNR